MSKQTKFILLQASVVFNKQMSIFDEYDDTKEGRNRAFRDTIDKLVERKIVKINPRLAEYVLLYKTKVTEDLIYCQLAKRTQVEMFNLQEDMIKKEPVDSYPPLDVFINLVQQKFAVELNSTLLSESAIESTIKNLINNLVIDFSIFVNTIQDQKVFWNLVSANGEIKEISFDLIVPNLFNAAGAANDLVSDAKETLNADSVDISFKNKTGGLKATIESIDSFVKYSSATGSWKLKIRQPGETKFRIIKSTDVCRKKEIESDILELIRKIDSDWQVSSDVYYGLLENIKGLFSDEE